MKVRLTRIEGADLNHFKFDYDLTFMVFFMDSEGRIISRYGGRDSRDADNRQSLAGLGHVMEEVLDTFSKSPARVIAKSAAKPLFAEGLGVGSRGCMHCHQVQEAINRKLVRNFDWDPEAPWRYPLPENVGIRLYVDQCSRVEKVMEGSPAAKAGIIPGDQIRQVGDIPVLSFADMQQALEEAPREGKVRVVYRRQGLKDLEGTLNLAPRWKKTDITWRTSLRGLVPTLPLAGKNLTVEEKVKLELPEKALAFRQRDSIAQVATSAGFKSGDVILGVEGKSLEMDVYGFQDWVRREYLVGDTIQVSLVRDGKKMILPIVLGRR